MKRAKKIILMLMACMMAASGTQAGMSADAAAHAHKWAVHSVSKASCTRDGYVRHVCTKCGKHKSASVKKLGHFYVTDKKAATCTASGHSRKYCARCGKTVSKITYKKLGHDYRARKATAAEKKAYGWGTTLTCRRCGHKTGSYADY